MSINVSPLYNSAQAIGPHFIAQHHGVFINISSISAPRPRPNLVWYAGSKGAVSAITKGLAAEYAPHGIRANAICPVVAETGMVASVLGGKDTVEGRGTLTKGIPLGRFATPWDIGCAACWLASEEAGMITGIELPVSFGVVAVLWAWLMLSCVLGRRREVAELDFVETAVYRLSFPTFLSIGHTFDHASRGRPTMQTCCLCSKVSSGFTDQPCSHHTI
jgi:hypothetical protein